MSGADRISGPEAAALYAERMREREKAEQDRVASLPVEEALAVFSDVVRVGASLRRLIAGSATGGNSREPAAPDAPRPAAAEAPDGPAGKSPLVTRLVTALMEMDDVEFLTLTNKVVSRYHAAIAALAPPGHVPHRPEAVACIHCGAKQTHRVCQACLDKGL